MAGLHFEIDGTNEGLIRKLRESRQAIINSGDVAEQQGVRIENSFKRIAAGAATLGVGLSIKELITNITQVRGEFQKFEAVLGNTFNDTGKAKEAMRMISNFAASTPFQVDQLTGSFVKLANMGFVPTLEEMTKMGDLASSTGKGFDQLTEAIIDAQTGENERLKEFGIRASVNGNKVTYTFKEQATTVENTASAIRAYILSLGDLQGVQGANAKISATLTGEISNLSDKFTDMYNEIGQSTEGIISSSIGGVAMIVENYEAVGHTIMELVAVYGSYKAILISVAAYQGAVTGITYTAEITALQKLLPLKQQSANEDVIAAVVSGKLTQSKAEQIIALRAEIAAKIQSLQATEAQTKVEYSSAMANYKYATQRMILARQNMAIAQSQMSIAIKSGTVEEIAIAKKNAQTASLELNNAAIAKNTTHKSLNTAATNRKSASETLNTLETGKNSVAQTVNTASTNILTVAKTKLAAASRALGLSMLANPYVLAAVAVAGLGYAIYKTATAETEMSKATSLLNKHLGESTSASLSEQRELARLKGELQGCKEGSEEYSKVKSEIISKFGKYDKTLTDETLSVQTLTEKYISLTKAIQSSFGARQYENFKKEQQDSLDKVFSKNLGKLQDRLSDELGDEAGSKIYTKIRLALLEGKELDQDVKSVLDKIQDKGTMFADSRADAYINNIREAQEAADNIDKKAKVKFGINNDDISKQGEGGSGSKGKEAEKKAASEWLSSYKKAYEDAEKAYNDFLKSKKLMSDADRDKELKRLKGLRDKTKTTYESKGGSTSSDDKQENQSDELRQQNEKLKLLTDKQSLDRIRAEEDAANEIAQAKIDADQDGAEKVLKQREFNHEKELLAIKREVGDRKQAVIDAARSAHESNSENKKKAFDADKFVKSEPAKKQFAIFDKVAEEKTKTTETKYYRGDDLNDLINEYQDFADRRMSIEKKFNEDLKVLDAQRKTALEKGDMDQVDKIDRSKVEAGKKKKEDLSGVSLDEFKADIDWATLFGNLDVLSPESLNKLRDKLKAFIETAADKLKPEDLKVLSEAMTNIDLTIADKTPYEALKSGISGYKTATDEASVAQGKLNQLQKDGKEGTEAYKDATRELTDAQRKRQESLKTMTQATNNIGEKGKELVTAGSDITDMLTSLGVSIPESISGALDGMGQVMDSLASIDFMKPMSIITGITGTLAGLGKTIGSFFGGNGDKAAKDSERLEEVNNRIAESEKIINGLIEKRIELIKEATIAEQKNLSVTTQQAINNQKKYYEQQLDGLSGNWLLAKSGKNNNLTLEDLGIGSIKELEEFLNSDRLLELQRDGYGIRDAEQWKAIIDGYNSIIDKEEELQDMMAKNLTGMTLDDAKNALDDFVRDADTSFSDVADNFEDHMRDAMFNIVKQNYLNKAMEDWYKDFEESMSDGALDKEEAGSLKNRYENAYTEAQNRYLAMLEAAGISAESDPTREASKKGIATASQDSVDENNGRLTVIQGHTYSINEKLTEITNFGRVIMSNCAHLPRLEDIGNNLRALTVSQDVVIGHLSNIEKNTARLEAIENTMVSMNRGIQDINTKGLTLKR